MDAAERYAERIDAVGEQRQRLLGAHPLQQDRWSGALAKRFRADPRREPDPPLAFVLSQVQPDDVFVDVGGGAGRVALPVALHCREVVVVDPSEGMQREFDELVAESGIKNARYVRVPWQAATEQFEGDIVFASHVTYFVRDIRPFLERMTAAARRQAMLLIASVPPPNMSARLFELVFGEPQELVPGQAELLPVLWEMGIVPEVRVLAGPFAVWETALKSRQEAVDAALAGIQASDRPDARQKVEEHFDELFHKTPDGFLPAWRPDSKTLIISWKPDEVGRPGGR